MQTKELNVLAFDIGSSSGRAILGRYNGKRITLEEILRFNAGVKFINNNYYWDILRLYHQIKLSIKKAVEVTGNNLTSIGIDTCGVDYGLLDKKDNLLTYPYFHRDHRTNGLLDEILSIISKKEIYKKTGIQFMQINTLVQLYADLKFRPWILENTKSLLFIPDLLNFFLTAKKYNEYTIASTSQMYNPKKEEWDSSIIERLKLPSNIMQNIIYPGNEIGDLLDNVKKECSVKGKLPVIAVGSHDTASAIAGTPLINRDNSAYISCGTWSLLGMELSSPLINEASMKENFTNELGLEKTTRFLTNITGLWLIQQCKKKWDKQGLNLSFQKINDAANKAKPEQFKLDVNDPCFLNPHDMTDTIINYCKNSGQKVPQNYATIARGIYESLAWNYKLYIEKLENLVGVNIENINMVGGGIQAELLCQFTANTTEKKVITGPVNGTAMGNILAQLLAKGEITDLHEGRQIIKKSVDLKEYSSSCLDQNCERELLLIWEKEKHI